MNSNEIIELARAKIDAEILELQERIRSLRTSRNALAPVYSLPPEVTTQIFKWFQLLYCGSIECNYKGAPSLPKWTKVTHVSQHWRNVAFNSKFLHTTLISHNLKYSREVVKHSGGTASLTLIDTMDPDHKTQKMWQTAEFQEFVLGVLPRVKRLWLENDEASTFLGPRLSTLPLEELSIENRMSLVPSATFPSSLRRLRLRRCLFQSYDWLSQLRNIVNLELRPTHHSVELPVDTLLDILDAMPHLKSFTSTCLLGTATRRITRDSPIRSQLQSFSAMEYPDCLVQLLPFLSFDPRFGSVFQASLGNQDNTPSTWLSPLLTQISRHLQSSSMVFHVAQVSWDEDSRDENIQTILYERENQRLTRGSQIVLPKVAFPEDLIGRWWKSLVGLPLSQIDSLVVDTPCQVQHWHDSPWHALDSLRRLTIDHEAASRSFLEYLIRFGQTKKGTNSRGVLPFSSMNELSLYGIKYNQEYNRKVVNALTSRMENYGVRLMKLVFYDCTIRSDAIQQLSRVVDVVEKHGKRKPEKKRRF